MVDVECWILRRFEDTRVFFAALIQLRIVNGEVIDAEKCTVKHSCKWFFISRCLLSGLSDLMPGQACVRCGKRLIETKIQRALSGMPVQLIERVNMRITQMKRDMEMEARLFSHLDKLLETKICSANEKTNAQLRIWEALHEEVEKMGDEVKTLRDAIERNNTELKGVLEANSASLKGDISEVKNLLDQQGQKIEALKEELARLYAKVTEGMEKIDMRFYEEKMAHMRMEIGQIGARFHSTGVRGSRIPPLIREIHPG